MICTAKYEGVVCRQAVVDLIYVFLIGMLSALILHFTGGCPCKATVGIYCPGCGFTHAFIMLMRCKFDLAWEYNPAVYFIAASSVWYLAFGDTVKNARAWNFIIWFTALTTTWLIRLIIGFPEVMS